MKRYRASMWNLVLSLTCLSVSASAEEAKVTTKAANHDQQPSTETVTLWEQAQRLYEQATRTGSTTATSAADWVGELYDATAKNAHGAANASTSWIAQQYNNAVKTGETSATTAKAWVVDDLSKIGTWQYKVVWSKGDNDILEKQLNELGAQRWECFGVHYTNGRNVQLYLKRQHRSYLQQLPAKDLIRLAPMLKGAGQGE